VGAGPLAPEIERIEAVFARHKLGRVPGDFAAALRRSSEATRWESSRTCGHKTRPGWRSCAHLLGHQAHDHDERIEVGPAGVTHHRAEYALADDFLRSRVRFRARRITEFVPFNPGLLFAPRR
jgi:hypothetical protein